MTELFDASDTATYGFSEVDEEVGILSVVTGADQDTKFELADGPTRIGSGPAAEVQLNDRGVSRLHCELVREDGAIRLRDVGSKNGTWVAGCRIFDALVAPGTRIRVGATTLELELTRRKVQRAVWHGGNRMGELWGQSAAMHRLFASVARLAGADQAVLLRGESGSGKELVARAVHTEGPRRDGPFVVVDGAAISRTLADVELFGNVRGAFTGANVDRAGAFERADGGTVFIDEVGELPIEVQAKMLRALDHGEVRRVGDEHVTHVKVRVVAATHRNLEKMVNEGAFREDLLHRLRVFEVTIPPLRERPEDVVLIARRFLEEIGPVTDEAAQELEKALAARAGYRWPGNVRELRSFVRRLSVFGDTDFGAPAPPGDAPHFVRVDLPLKDAKKEWIEAMERQYLARLLAETNHNISAASRRAGMDRGHLGKLVAQYGLKK